MTDSFSADFSTPLAGLHFGGHETFPLRHTWMPKIVDLVGRNSEYVSDDFKVMEELGIGRNMAKAVRHWAISAKMVDKDPNGNFLPTPVAETLFSERVDPYLERIDSIWLLHYLIASNPAKNSFWYFLFNYFTSDIVARKPFLETITAWSRKYTSKPLSQRTLERDFACCMRMYCVPKSNGKSTEFEDLLSSPLKELRLIYSRPKEGEYVLRRVNTQEVSPSMFSYCLIDFLEKLDYPPSLTIDEILLRPSSPARVFRVTESALVEYLLDFQRLTKGKYFYDSTAGMRQLLKNLKTSFDKQKWLERVYR